MATQLALAGVYVQLFDSHPGPTAKLGETLPPTLRPLLERLGLLGACDASPHRQSYGNRSYWGGDAPVEKDFLFAATGSGWHLDRQCFEATLAEYAVLAGVDWHWDHHAIDAHWAKKRWVLEVEASASVIRVEADLVIDATGRSASFARGAGARRQSYDRLVGAAVTFQANSSASVEADSDTALSESPDAFTVVEATRDGWWYTAPLSGGRMVAVYMTDGDLVNTRELRTFDGWCELLSVAKRSRQRLLPWLAAPSARNVSVRIVPAGSARLQKVWGEGWLAVGDSATSFDPLSSNGIGAALTSGYYGACAAADHLKGNLDALDAYSDLLGALFDDYLTLLGEYYAAERRWPASKFWARRHRPTDQKSGRDFPAKPSSSQVEISRPGFPYSGRSGER